jgi:hypothetical protein
MPLRMFPGSRLGAGQPDTPAPGTEPGAQAASGCALG